MSIRWIVLQGCAFFLILVVVEACSGDKKEEPIVDTTSTDSDADGDADGDADSDSDADADGDMDSDSDSDGDFDTEKDTTDTEKWATAAIEPDCEGVSAVGDTLKNMRFAIDLCDDQTFVSQEYVSPTKADTEGTFAAVERFGADYNHLEPLMNGSYALMATGPAVSEVHNGNMGGGETTDAFSKDDFEVYDVMEWRLRLKAPEEAQGIQIHYVFFSTEYDEYVGTEYNDKFYIFIENSKKTNNGEKTVINFTECRDPEVYSDFKCPKTTEACTKGDKMCYIAINTALSECCWKDGCDNGKSLWTTRIEGTGFSCAELKLQETDGIVPSKTKGSKFGSSTGWLATEWPIEPGEEFDLIFHIHDTSDHLLDSEVIIDKVLFLTKVKVGTRPV